MKSIKESLINNFVRYAAISSQSDASVTTIPSSEGQRTLATLLCQELNQMGISETQLLDNSIAIARIPGTVPNAKTIGFVAHLDTVDVGLSPNINPQILHYLGEPLCLNQALNIFIDETSHPELANYRNQDILFSDGTSVLGADNKSAIAIMMTLAADVMQNNTEHGDIYLAFVPDEEIGLRGSKELSLEHFPVDYCYTIDCCERGEVIYETFNAGSAVLEIKGITAHPMSAKNVLVNPNLIAADFISLVRDHGLPEQTEGREGYFWVTDLSGNQNVAKVSVAIRDFDQDSYNARKAYLASVVELLKNKHPRAGIELTLTDVYSNIAQAMGEDTSALSRLYQALETLGIPAKTIAMRGGTDGSALSVKGLFTPNFFTGAHNFHSQFEFLPLDSFEDSYYVAKQLITMK